MAVIKENIKLLRRRRTERLVNKPLWPSREHLSYLRNFFKKRRGLLLLSLSALFLQGLFEVALILVSHRYLKSFSGNELAVSARALFALLLILALLYLTASYTAIKSERTLIVRLINDLRARWFKLFLNKRPEENNVERKGMLLSKISYHLPLFSTGLANSLAGLVRWVMFVAILLFLAFTFSYKLLLFAAGAILVGLIIGFAAFWVSYNYVTKETTFYSQIIRLVDFNLSDWQFVKQFQRERTIAAEFDKLVELDSYFRIRRDLWLRFSISLVFVLLVFFGFFAGSWNSRLEYYFGAASLDTRFVMIIMLVYFSRLLYESLRVGLYSVPLLLGLKLSVPDYVPRKLGAGREIASLSLTFSAAKTKLFARDKKYRRFNYEFKVGGRYVVSGGRRSGRSSLAKLLTGRALYGRRSWLIKTGKKRYFYNEFFDKFAGCFYLDAHFTSARSLIEVVVGKEKTSLTPADLAAASNLVNEHPELRAIFFEREDWRYSAEKYCNNQKSVFLVQAIYCLINKPYLIAFDNAWFENKDEDISKLLNLMERLLPQTILVVFKDDIEQIFSNQINYEI